MKENKVNETLNTNETLIDQIETLKSRIKNIESCLHSKYLFITYLYVLRNLR